MFESTVIADFVLAFAICFRCVYCCHFDLVLCSIQDRNSCVAFGRPVWIVATSRAIAWNVRCMFVSCATPPPACECFAGHSLARCPVCQCGCVAPARWHVGRPIQCLAVLWRPTALCLHEERGKWYMFCVSKRDFSGCWLTLSKELGDHQLMFGRCQQLALQHLYLIFHDTIELLHTLQIILQPHTSRTLQFLSSLARLFQLLVDPINIDHLLFELLGFGHFQEALTQLLLQ